MSSPVRKFFVLTIPATFVAACVLAIGVEVWVRATWNPQMGSPGLFISDAVLGQRLAPGYDGWFAGVPVHINALGFRADRDEPLEKGPSTFRILVLGDSVTFGHGSVQTYPALLQGLLKQWRPEVDFQVWNAAVPGYNTSQELAQLDRIGPLVHPDLVVVGFFENDVVDNRVLGEPSAFRRASSAILAAVERHVYSLQLYKRIYLTTAWWLSGSTEEKRRLEHLDTESALLAKDQPIHERSEQQLTDYARLTPDEMPRRTCIGGERPDPEAVAALQGAPDWDRWVDAVHGFQDLQARGVYRIVFFLNVVPPICTDRQGSFFYEGGSRAVNEVFLGVMRGVTPAASVFDTFLLRRPGEMPAARAHAIGNSNLTKAEALYAFLRENVLPGMLDASTASDGK